MSTGHRFDNCLQAGNYFWNEHWAVTRWQRLGCNNLYNKQTVRPTVNSYVYCNCLGSVAWGVLCKLCNDCNSCAIHSNFFLHTYRCIRKVYYYLLLLLLLKEAAQDRVGWRDVVRGITSRRLRPDGTTWQLRYTLNAKCRHEYFLFAQKQYFCLTKNRGQIFCTVSFKKIFFPFAQYCTFHP